MGIRSAILWFMGAAGAPRPSRSVHHGPIRVGGGGGGDFAPLDHKAQYAAGTISRRDPDFIPRGLGPNAMAELGGGAGGLDLVVRRMRDLGDNNELVDGAAETWLDNVVGTGIDDVEPDTGFEDLNEQIAALWEWAIRRVDPERCMTLGEDQRLFGRELYLAGECIVYYPMAEAFRGYPTMPAVELIDRERMPLDLTGVHNGNEVRQGVEYDAKGRVVAYHVLREHPRDGGWSRGITMGMGASIGSPGVMRLSAEDAEASFFSRRIAQLRGVPRPVSVVETIRKEDAYQRDVMDQAHLAACLGAFFESPDDNLFRQPSGANAAAVDAMGNPITRIEGATVGFVRKGGGLQIVGTNLPQQGFENATAVLQRRMSRALRVPYSALSGDASRTTFSSMRGEGLDARKGYRPAQRFVWEHHTEPWRRRLIDWAVLTGRITLTGEQVAAIAKNPETLYRCEVGYPGWDYVNPAQEANAAATDIKSGVKSPVEVIQERGGNWRRTVRQAVKYASFRKQELEAAGLEASDLAGAEKSAAPAEKANAEGPEDKEDSEKSGGAEDAVGAEDALLEETGSAAEMAAAARWNGVHR